MADSDRIVEIIIETNDKTGGALGAVQSKLLAFDKAVLRTQERLKRMTKDTYQASIGLIDKVTPQGSKINSLLKGFAGKAYQASIGLIDRTTGGIRSLEAKLMQLTGKAYNVTVGLKDQASKGIKNIADGALMQTTGMGLSMLGTAGIGYGVVNAFQSQMDFEKQMSAVKAIMGDKANVVLSVDADTGKATTAFDALVKKAEEMGATTKFTSGEAAKALYYMGMAGWDADKSMAGLPALMNLAAAANEDLARTSDIMTDSMTGFGVNAGEMIRNASGDYVEASQHFADMLAAVATGANTDVSTMGETFKYSASSIQAMYSSGTAEDRMRGAEDLALITGIMANAGIKGSQAGTSQKALFTRLSALQRNADYARESLGVDFVDQETGQTRRLRDVIGDFRKRFNEGVSPDEMIDLAERLGGGEKIQKDTKKKLSAFLEHVQENGGKMSDSDKMMMTSMLTGQEAMSGWLAAFLASDEDWNRLAESIDNFDGKAEEMAKIQLDNLAGDFTMLGSAWDAFQRSFVKGKASEGLRDFIQSVTDTVSKANKLFEDGIQVGDFGVLILDVIKKLKDKFLEFDGIGSILAGGALAGGLVKLTQKAMGLIDKLKSLKELANGFGGNDGNGNVGTVNGANNRSGVGNNGMNGASSKVGTMTVNANVVNINSRNSGGGNGAGGTGNGENKGNRNNGSHSGAGAGTGGHGGTGNPPPSSGGSRFGRMAKVGGGLLTAATVALSAYDIYDTNRSYDEQSAEIDKKDQKAQENFDLMSAKHETGEVSDEELSQARQRLIDQQNKSAEERQQLETDRTNDMGAAVGGTVGSVAGGAIGAVVGGPMGAMVGSMIGSELGSLIGGNIAEIQAAFEQLPATVSNVWNNITTSASTAFDGLKNKVSSVWADIKISAASALAPVAEAFEPITSAAKSAWDTISNEFIFALNVIVGAGAVIFGALAELFEPVIDAASEAFDGISETISSAFDGVVETVSSVIDSVSETLTSVSDSISESFDSAFEGISEVISPAVSGIAEVIAPVWDSISSAASAAWDTISSSVGSAFDAITSTFGQLASWFESTVWSPISSAVSGVTDTITSAFTSAVGAIQGAWSGLVGWFESNIIGPIKEKFSALASIGSSITGLGGGGGKAMAEGGFLTAPQHILAGEAGPEVIIPLSVGRRNRAKDLLAKTLNILNGNADAAGFNSSEKLQTQSSQEETDELGNLKAYQGMADNLIKIGDLSPIIDAKLREQRKYVHNQRKQSEELQMQAKQQAQEARVLSSIPSYETDELGNFKVILVQVKILFKPVTFHL